MPPLGTLDTVAVVLLALVGLGFVLGARRYWQLLVGSFLMLAAMTLFAARYHP